MARIKKYASNQTTNLQPQLTQYGTFITDTLPLSRYFRISEFKDTFTGGKNGFLIEGSEHLLESTEIKIEIIDVDGNPIYYEPGDGIPEYYEGLSKLVAVHIYEDTPIGIAKITILGELKTYLDVEGNTQPIPEEWKGVYNVKWEKEFKVNRLIANEDRVRFYKRPQVSITELIKPLYSNIVAQKTNTGTISGIPLAPLENQPLSEYSLPTSYLLTITDNDVYNAWSSSIVGNTISVPSLGYTTTAQEIINKTQLVVTNPYTDTNGLVQSFSSSPYTTTFNYLEGVNDLKTALTGSFAKISLTDLTSFVGDVARVKVFRKSQSDLSDFQFIQEIQLEANELLLDLDTTTKNQENYGIFTSDIIKDYWVTSSNNLTATFNQSYLYDSVKLNSNSSIYKFHTSKSISINEGVEYTLDFKVRGETSTGNGYIKAFLSGSKDGTSGKVQVEQEIINVPAQTAILQKSTVTKNIIAEQMATASLYFEVSGNDWYIADVSLKASQESSFSPDEITFIQSVPRTLPEETFIYRFEFYDINNNYIPVNVEETKTFNGGNLQTIRKGLQLIPSSLYFQFDSGSNPVPPTAINIQVVKTLLTGSVHYTSQSVDYDGSTHTTLDYAGGQYPGVLNQTNPDNVILTVQNFTGSRSDKNVQYLEITGEVEGYTDTIVITKVLDGFGGVNYIIRPYRGTQIRNSSTASLEIQAVRIDGINEIILNDTIGKPKGWPTHQLHVISQSNGVDYFINLEKAVANNYIKGLSVGELGSKQINYNAIFNRDSINKARVVYILSSGSLPPNTPAYIASASVLSSITLEDLQDGLDAGFMAYNTDTFTINPRTEIVFTPVSASVTGSFYKRGTNIEPFTASFEVFPSMSLNLDYEPEYWMYYVTGKFHPNISVVAIDDKKNTIPSRAVSSYTGLKNQQSKTLTVTLTYTEDYTSSSISLDKTFTIVPQGKPGDESIVFEVVPANVTLNSNAEGVVLDYKPSITDIKLKQGSRYLVFTGSRAAGTFHIATASIGSQNIKAGNVHFTSSFGVAYTASLIVSASSNLTDLSGSITYPLIIHPYYTSSIYTQSIVQNYTKAVDGPPSIDVILTPPNISLNADEVGFVSSYSAAQTTIQLREGSKFLTFNSASTAPGTFRFGTNPTQNITLGTLQGNGTGAATASFSLFNYPHVSASVNYNIIAYPYSLGPGHRFTSSVINRTQNITKNVATTAARTVNLTSTAYTVTYDSDGQVINPTDGITLVATAFNTTGSKFYQFFKDDIAQTPIQTTATKNVAPEDAVAAGEVATWKVTLRDGSNAASAPIRAQASVTIAGVKDGTKAYNAVVNPENTSIVYKVSGELEITNTSAVITATKGGDSLTHKPSGFSAQTQDPFGNNIGSLGEYQVTIHSKSSHITLGDSKVSGSVLNGSTNATIGNVAGWVNPEGNPTGQIVYRIDFENGKQISFKTQSIAIQFEGATGPGIVMRGQWDEVTNYIGSVETVNYRRDAVIFPDPSGSSGITHYWAAISGSGPASVGAQKPTSPTSPTYTDTSYWQYLGQQDFFVAAKIAIFEESFVKNTINVGNNIGSPFANIVLAGGRNDPYMAIGQNGTVGGNDVQYDPSTHPTIIGYDKIGIFAGMYNNASTYEPRFSLRGSGGNYMRWNGTSLDMSGTLNAGGMKLGPDVNGTNDGLYINSNNYWYDTGNFKVGDGTSYVAWNGSTMEVKGSITVTGGDAATQTYASSSAATALTSANGYTSLVDARVFTDSTGKIVKVPSTGIAGLYLGSSYMGYHDGVSTWKTYMSNTGNFYLIGTNGYLSWDSGLDTLSIKGQVTATSGTIGPWNIGANSIYYGTEASSGTYASAGNITLGKSWLSSANFRIDTDGSAYFTGTVTATAGTIAGWSINSTQIYKTVSGDGITIDSSAKKITFDGAGSIQFNGSGQISMYGSGGILIQGGGTSITSAGGIYLYNTNSGVYAERWETNPHSAGIAYSTSYAVFGNANGSGARSGAFSGGNLTCTDNIIAYYSDERLKNIIGNIPNALDKINKLNGFYYTNNDLAKSVGYKDDKIQIGVSAQEVKNVLPEVISLAPFDIEFDEETRTEKSKSGENYMTVQYDRLVPILIEAIKELSNKVEKLENQLKSK